jgi:hypothetical protein
MSKFFFAYILGSVICLWSPSSSQGAAGQSKRLLDRIWMHSSFSEDIYVQFCRKGENNPIARLFFNVIFLPDMAYASSEKDFAWHNYQNKLISHVYVSQVGVVQRFVEDNYLQQLYKKIAYPLFPPTKSWVINSRLTFKVGDLVDVQQLQRSLESLRKLPYIKQAELHIIPHNANTVAIRVATEDKLPIQVGLDQKRKIIKVQHCNVAGWGHTWINYFSYDKKFGYGFTYQWAIPVMGYLIGEINYLHTYAKRLKRVAIFQNFNQASPHAGMVEISKQRLYKAQRLDGRAKLVPIAYNFYYRNLWLGKTWASKHLGLEGQFYVSARIEQKDFKGRPVVRPVHNRIFHNHIFMLASFGFAYQKPHNEHFVLHTGSVEPMLTGLKYNLIGGYQVGEFWNRPYVGIAVAKAQFIPKLGYLMGSSELGGFLRYPHLEQELVKLSVKYFTPLLASKHYRIRHFFKVDYLAAFNLFTGECLSKDTKRKRGKGADAAPLNHQRLQVHLETVCWPKQLIAGCQVATLAFLEAVVLPHASSKIRYFWRTLGFGFRIGHDRFSFGTIQANLSYNPSLRVIGFSIGTSINWCGEDFRIGEPKAIAYRHAA